MADLRSLMVDRAAVRDGSWTTWYGTSLRIARISKPEFLEALRGAGGMDSLQAVDDADASGDAIRKIAEAVAGNLLTDWSDVEFDGEALEFSPEKAAEVLAMPELGDLLRFVINYSAEAEHFRVARVQASAGN